MIRRVAPTLALLSVAIFLSGCVTLPDPEASQEFSGDVIGVADGAHTVSQTLVARRPRLNGVELWLESQTAADAATTLTVELWDDPEAPRPLASTRLDPAEMAATRPVRVLFPPQGGPLGQRYYLRLKASGGEVSVLGRQEDAYPGGQAFVDGAPEDADLAFRLYYDYGARAMLGDLLSVLPHAWLALPLTTLLLLPGRLLLGLLGLRGRFDGGEQVALAAGLSVALVPLALLWTSFVGLRWSQPAVVVAAVLLVAVLAWRVLRRFGWPPRLRPMPGGRWGWALAGIFALSLAGMLLSNSWLPGERHCRRGGCTSTEGASLCC